MKFVFSFLFLIPSLFATSSDFITKDEYAKMLYKNPRGIGCHKCHGENGEGKVIATYKEKGLLKSLQAPKINNISKEKFTAKFKKRKFKMMPSYYLTNEEIESLYHYLNKIAQ
jgi:hypothetical protein